MTLAILVGTGLVLFALAFFTKRRYGVLGLGLTAGLVLSQEVTKEVAGGLEYVDFPIGPFPVVAAASLILILLPALILLLSGPRYSDQRYALVGSALFAVYALILVLGPVVTSMPAADRMNIQPLLSTVAANTPLIIALGITLAVVDVMHAHGKPASKTKGKH